MNKFVRLFADPYWAFGVMLQRIFSRLIKNDELYIKLRYFSGMKKFPDLKHPRTYNEKLQWLKLNDKHTEYTRLVDKYAVKEYIEKLNWGGKTIPTLGVWDRFDDIDFAQLPNQFVLKTTHDSGGIVIVKDKGKMDMQKARKKLEKSLRRKYFLMSREYPYKDVKPRIIAEKFMVDESGTELKDYKFFCFNGKVRFFKIDFGRFSDHHANYYDTNGRILPFGEKVFAPRPKENIELPSTLNEMIKCAEMISTGCRFLRVDFYEVGGKMYFGEATFYPGSGLNEFTPKEWDYKIGGMLRLPTDID